jgi:hypothetical protein
MAKVNLSEMRIEARFDPRFFHPFRADLSIRKSPSLFPPLIAATSQRALMDLRKRVDGMLLEH